MIESSDKVLTISDIGRTDFYEAWGFQKQLVTARAKKLLPDCLIITEHEPVITMGRGTDRKNLLVTREELKKRNIDLYGIERGGDITLHSPGQVMAYPILDLAARGKDLHRYLRDLEKVMINTLDEFGMKATVRKGLTGVWVENHKIGAIGVAVSQWVTYHGMALNVCNDLELFKLINPCGITMFPVGSISSLSGKKINRDKTAEILAEKFAEVFGYENDNVEHVSNVLAKLETVNKSDS